MALPVSLCTYLLGFQDLTAKIHRNVYQECGSFLSRTYCSFYAVLGSPFICSGYLRFGDIAWSVDSPVRTALRARVAHQAVDLPAEMAKLCAVPEGTEKNARYRELIETRFQVENVRGDGNCGLRAIVCSLYPNYSAEQEDEAIAGMRQRMVDYMRRHRRHFEPFIDGDFDDYLAHMARSRTWIGNPELRALSQCEGINIQVFSAAAPQLDWRGRMEAAPNERFNAGGLLPHRTARIYFESAHYQALHPR
jgi:hypothetical protein